MKTIEESVEVEFPIAKIAGGPAGEARTLKVAFEPARAGHGGLRGHSPETQRAARHAWLIRKTRMTCPTTIRTSSSS